MIPRFIVSCKRSLKCVPLHNGNAFDLFLLGIQQLSKKNVAKLNLYWKNFHITNTTGSFVLI